VYKLVLSLSEEAEAEERETEDWRVTAEELKYFDCDGGGGGLGGGLRQGKRGGKGHYLHRL